MIIKNPYAAVAKNYKVINILLLIPTVYLLIQMTNLAGFFETYVLADYFTAEKDLVEKYIPALTLLMPLVTAILHFVVWLILILKKKKYHYHAISAGYHLIMFLALVFFYSSLLNIEMQNMTSTLAGFIRDISDLCIYPFYLLLVMGAVNIVGLNIKTLRFDRHADLKVTEDDEEEIEVKVGTDNIDTKRRVVHILRELRYYLIENKAIFALIIIGICIMIGYRAYLNYEVFNKTYNVNQSFALDNFSLSVKDSYITTVDYRGQRITKDKYYLAIKIGIHNQGEDTKIDKTVFKLYIDNKEVFASYDRASRFLDFGAPYQGEVILADQAKDYVFVYELTEKQLQNSYEMRILNGLRVEDAKLIASYRKINVRPKYLTEIETKSPKKEGEKVKLSASTLEETTYTLKDLHIVTNYKYSYQVCVTKKKCNMISDTIVPTGGKVLMVVEDDIVYDKSTAYYAFDDKNFYEDFVTLEYTFNINSGMNTGQITQIGNVVDVTPKTLEGVKIFEVPGNVINSYKLNLLITIRNQVYSIKVLE